MSLEPGTKLAHYEILAPLGKGGMGEVYLAKDSKLGRDVAIKVLPDELAEDEERLRRFQREAKVLASLNHPNIAAIYGLEQSDETHYLVLELVPGETLAEPISRGPIPVDEALGIATKIAEALEEAHERGIVHRDLKPANIKLTPDDKVKVLDFGLAKAFVDEIPDADSSMSPTLTRDATRAGVILGTAAYMSPEQAKGKRVDRRADVWAFGAVVYEMLTGHRAFGGEDVSETLASVLAKEPAWEDLPSETPPALRQVLRACLTKDPNERVRDIADVRLAISGAFMTPDPESVAPIPALRRRALVAVAIAAGVAGALIGAWALSSRGGRAPVSGPTARVSVMVPANRPVPESICFPCRVLSISADGTQLVYTGENLDLPPGDRGARWQLELRSLATLEVRDLPGTSGASQPFFSPDGKWVAFFTATGELTKASLSGGNPITLVEELNGSRWSFGVWTEDDTIVFDTPGGSLASISAEGGETTVLTTLDDSAGESYHGFPAVVPGSRAVLFTVGYHNSNRPTRIEAAMRDSGERRVVIENARAPLVLASGHLLFQRGEAILVASFDVDRLMVTGPAVPLVDAVRFDNPARSRMAQLAVSRTGTLAYLPLADRLGTLGLVGRDGSFEPLNLPPGHAETPRVAPDGRAVAFVEARGSKSEARVYDLARGSTTKLGPDGPVRWLAWHPDNRSLAVGSRDDGSILSGKLDGPEELLVPAPEDAGTRDFSWSPDGAHLAYTVQKGSQYDIWVKTFGDAPATEPFLETDAVEYGPAFSPDGRWLAYGSDESGRGEVYIRRYPSGERFAVSTEGGFGPVWSPDGREIYFQGFSKGNEKLFAVSVTVTAEATSGGSGLRLGAPVPLFDLRAPGPTGVIEEYVNSSVSGISYDILPDGKRFLMVRRTAEQGTREIVLVQNFFEELKRLASTKN